MNQNNESTSHDDDDELNAQTLLDGLTDLATQMGHATDTMEIIGIATPDNAEALKQKTSDSNNIVTLPKKPPSGSKASP